jgi:preprotein translocase subunit YajC
MGTGTVLLVVGLFVMGVGLYALMLNQQRREEQQAEQATHDQLDSLLSSVKMATEAVKSRISPKQEKKFTDALHEAMKDNP